LNKIEKFIAIAGINYAFINLIDLYFTLNFFEYEINPLVINNPAFFYIFKLFTSFILLTICIYKVTEWEK